MIGSRLCALLLIAGSVPLAGCALHPLYAGGAHGPVGSTLASVSVAPIEGEAGWLVRTALRERLGAVGNGSADGGAADNGRATRYRIDVRLDDTIAGYGIRADDAVTRERRTLRARWQLVDTRTGATVLDATSGSDSGVDVVGSEYATIAAEHTALLRLADVVADQIIARIGQFAINGGGDPGASTN